MEKLLFLVPDVDVAKDVIATLGTLNIGEERIGVVANDEALVKDLPEPDVEDDSDVVPAFARGVAAGGVTGAVAGIAALAIPPLGLAAGGLALVTTTALGGASFGGFASMLVGTSVTNSQLDEYEGAIERGEILMIVDVEEDDEAREREIQDKLAENHPSLSIEGTKPAPSLL